MKIIILTLFILMSFAAGYALAAYIITLTDLRVENLQIYLQDGEIKMSMNSTLHNAAGDTRGVNDPIPLTVPVQAVLVNFLKPRVRAIAAGYDVNPPAWAAP